MENLQLLYTTTNNETFGKLTDIGISLPDKSVFVCDVDSFYLRKLRYNGLEITNNVHSYAIPSFPMPYVWGATTGLTIYDGIVFVVDKVRHVLIAIGVHDLVCRGAFGIIDTPRIALDDGFYSPTGVTSDGTFLYVVDSGNNRVVKLTHKLGFVSESSGDISLDVCYHICYDPDQNVLFIPHVSEGNIIECTTDFASIIRTIGNGIGSDDGYFLGLENVCVDDKYLYVADSSNQRIQVFDKFTGEWKAKTNVSFYYPDSVCYYDDKIFVVEEYGKSLKVLTNYDESRGVGSGFIEGEPLNTEVKWRIEP